jgi:hypothetical protein
VTRFIMYMGLRHVRRRRLVTSHTCKRLWEVEAARDGRLSGKALTAFEEHAAACGECGAERRALDALQRKLAEDVAPVDEISLRRQRERLLAQADSALREQPSGGRRAAVAGLAVACGVAAFIGWSAQRPKPEPARSSPIASIVASPGARWERHRTQGLEQVALTDGILSSTGDPRPTPRFGAADGTSHSARASAYR